MNLYPFLFFSFFLFIQPSNCGDSSSQTQPVCNYLSLQNEFSKTPIAACPFSLGSITYAGQTFYLCPSTTLDSVVSYNLNQTINATYSFNKSRLFSFGDTCTQLLADYSNFLVCSNQNSLVTWDIPSHNLTQIYNDSYWTTIPNFAPASQSYGSLILIEDGMVVKLVDAIKNQMLNSFGGGLPSTRSIMMQRSNFLGVHYNYEGKKMIELWDLSTVTLKYSWSLDLTGSTAILQGQRYMILGFKANLLYKWDFLYSLNSSMSFSTNNITQLIPVNGNDGQTKQILMLIKNEALYLYDSTNNVINATVEVYANPNIFLINYNQYNGLLLLKSNYYYMYNIFNQQFFKTLDIDLSVNLLQIFWNSTNNQDFQLLYQQNSLIYLESWNILTCQPIDLIKSPLVSFKSIVQIPSQNESLLLMLNQNNTFSLFSVYSRAPIQYFSGMSNAVFTSLVTLSCPNSNLILVNGYMDLSSGPQYRLFFLNLTSSKVSFALHTVFSSSINYLIYLNYRNFIAFENQGSIYIYDIINQNLINTFPHNLGSDFTQLIYLANFPYIIATPHRNSIFFWNIHEGASSLRFLSNYSFIDINIKLFGSMTLLNYKTFEVLMGYYEIDSYRVMSFWNVTGGNQLFQINDSRAVNMNYLKFFHFSINTVDYLAVLTDITNDIWNLNTQQLEISFDLPKLAVNFVGFQSSQTLVFDTTNNTIALWNYDATVQVNDTNAYSFCKQGYFLGNFSSDCAKCDSLCYSNCFAALYASCVPAQCNYLFEKSALVQSSQCSDCSFDNYFLVGNEECLTFNNYFTGYVSKTYSIGCLDGFYLYGNSCLACSPNCKSCYGNSYEECLECNDGFIYFNYKCYQKIVNDSFYPLMIVFAVIFGFVIIWLLLYILKTLYEERLFCIIWKKMCRCLNAIFFDDKFTSTIKRGTIYAPASSNNDKSQINGFMNHQEVELMFPSQTTRSSTKRPPVNLGNGNDHYMLLINAVNRFKGRLMETKELNKGIALKHGNLFLTELKEEIPFFLYELIDVEQDFSKNNYFQIKIVKKMCDSAHGPVFLGEKLCKTRFTVKIIFDNIDEVNIKNINRFLFFLNEQDKIKYNTLSKILPISALVYSSNKSNFCLGVMEESYDYNLDDFLVKFAKTIHFIQKLDLTLQILDTIKSLHDLNLSHRNIKANNVVINSEDVNYSVSLKINDFSKYMKISTMLYGCKSSRFNLFQLAYIPPEYYQKKNYAAGNKNSDIWSLGVLIYDIFYPDTSHSLDLPWIRFAEEMTEKYKKEEGLAKLLEVYQQELKIENNYCREDPAIRPEITEIINSCLRARIDNRIAIHELIWKVQWIKMKVMKE